MALATTGIVAATAAYLDAKYGVAHDLRSLYILIKVTRIQNKLVRENKLGAYYRVAENAAIAPNDVFLWFEGRTWTWKQTLHAVHQFAQWFLAQGVRPRDVVALDLMNRPEIAFAWWGLSAIGAAAAMINYNLASKQLVHCLNVSGARLALVDEEAKSKFEAVGREVQGCGLTWRVVDDAFRQEIAHMTAVAPDESLRQVITPQDLSNLFYTSGTTGLPKASAWHVGRWVRTTWGYALFNRIQHSDILFTQMPIYHASAAIAMHTSLFARCGLAMGKKFSVKEFWPQVVASRATVIQYVGETCRYLLAAPSSPFDRAHRVRTAFGNGMRPDVWDAFKKRFNIPVVAEFYGATEGIGASFNYSSNDFSSGAIGQNGKLWSLLQKANVAIVEFDWINEVPIRNAKGFCTRAPKGKPGELLQRIDQTDPKAFVGYYHNEEATNKKIIRNVFKSDDKWFRTGDIQRVVDDGICLWHFVDRIGDTFRWKSENVSTAEVSQVLGVFPAISEANVYGVQIPGHDGRAGCAALVMAENQQIDLKKFFEYASQELPRYAVPIFLRITRK